MKKFFFVQIEYESKKRAQKVGHIVKAYVLNICINFKVNILVLFQRKIYVIVG